MTTSSPGLDAKLDRYRVIAVTQIGDMILKATLLQRPVPARSVRALTHINVDTTALFEIDIVEIEGRRDGEEKIRGFKGRIATIEFKTQEEILPEDDLPIVAKETNSYQLLRRSPRWELVANALQLTCRLCQ